MKGIKFRVWNKKDGRMEILSSMSYDGDSVQVKIGNPPKMLEKSGIKDEFELMQSTGLKDKNGKDIYEGDILNRFSSFGTNVTKTEVRWWQYQWIGIDNWTQSEVIGNIYENPGLLKK